MARESATHRPELLEALRGVGIEPVDTKKVIIEINPTGPVIFHVEGYMDERAIHVIRAIGGDMRVVRGEEGE